MGKLQFAALLVLASGCALPASSAPPEARIETRNLRPYTIAFAAHTPGGAAGLTHVAALYQVPTAALAMRTTDRDLLGMTHTRYQQMHNGLVVYGAQLALHERADGSMATSTGTLVPMTDASLDVTVSAADAQSIARSDYGFANNLQGRNAGLAYALDDAQQPHLVHEVWITGETVDHPISNQVFIDAHTGDIVATRAHVFTLRNRKTYTANNSENLPGTQRLTETQTSSGDNVIDTIHGNVGKAYDCFKAVFARDSFDGQGGAILTSGHVGQQLNNAYWNSTQLSIGDGDGTTFSPLVDGDIITHELAHGLTERTAGLIYERQSGALNEAMSDISAMICQAHYANNVVSAATWNLAEGAFTPGNNSDAMRYAGNPTQDGSSKDHVSGMAACSAPTDQNDYCGVHSNSGIANLAFKLLVTGGVHPRAGAGAIPRGIQVPKLGMTRAAAIMYRALTTYMMENSDFAAARTAFAQAAMDLYPTSPEIAQAAELTWYAVGVGPTVANLSTGVGEPSGGNSNPDPTDPSDPTDPTDPSNPSPTGAPADYVGGCNTNGTGGAGAVIPGLALAWGVVRRRSRVRTLNAAQ
jgi:vibriolysin